MAMHHIYIDRETGEMGYQGDLAYIMCGNMERDDWYDMTPEQRVAFVQATQREFSVTPTRKV